VPNGEAVVSDSPPQTDLFASSDGLPPPRPLLFDRGGFDLVANLGQIAVRCKAFAVELGRDEEGMMHLTLRSTR